ncbi:HAD-IIB family hydrolase [Streptomyces sp. NBC_00078]|uniref:HAD-IIB family hydrolase n=1 Tax=unclassified Streptomyces TaxID=2593676 RepID=UPI0022506450|nr:HAD-IIB family hydrolase [Streptomyces sp. NBC_00078]MCX5422572.1 HAD-IIB family hydrolase [Streptomyces sp. NBC_00078]
MPPRSEASALPLPFPVRAVAFCDFDETYLAHSPTEHERACREALEDYLVEAGERHGLLFGWVTGSSLLSVLRKARAHGLRTLPHFVACSLGTELLVSESGELRPDPGWLRLMPDAESLGRSAGTVVRELSANGVDLEPQPGRAPDSLVKSYYYRSRHPEIDARNLSAVREAAGRAALGVSVSRCNPSAGDPADCYDVDLLPPTCGKRQVVRYVCQKYGIDPADTFAFGDSGNDLEMLAAVGHGVMVGNCTEEARGRHPRVSDRCHSDAVLTTLLMGLRARR